MCKKAICCHNCPDKSIWKKVLVWKKVTLVEKGHLGSISRPRPSASASKNSPLMPFFYRGNFFLHTWTIFPHDLSGQLWQQNTILTYLWWKNIFDLLKIFFLIFPCFFYCPQLDVIFFSSEDKICLKCHDWARNQIKNFFVG